MFLSSLVVYGCQINPPLLSICIAQCFLHDVNYGPIVSQYSVVRFRSKSLLIFLCQSVTCQQTTFAYLDEGVEYVGLCKCFKETRWLYHHSDSDVIEPIHCASRCWCLLEWQTARLADPRMRDTTWGCKLGQWQRLFHCLNYTLDEQVTWQLPPITLYIPTIWESPLSLFGL